jgi:hypothetical protein
MYYYATTTNSKPSSTTSFTTTIPTKTNAGTYYVWYYVKGDSNHNDTAISSTAVSVTIAKASRTISFTTAPTWVGTGKTATVVAAPSAGSGDGTITYSSSNTSKATISGSTVTGVSEGSVTITATISAGTNYNSATTSYSMTVINSTLYVDLGLPSGLLWATRNMDVTQTNKFAAANTEKGSFFSFGNTDGHNLNSSNTFDYDFGDSTSYNSTAGGTWASANGGKVLPSSYDAATVNIGAPWRMPTYAEINELFNNTTATYTTVSGVNGMLLTGANNNTMFLPVAGRNSGGTGYNYLNGWYRTSTNSWGSSANVLRFDSNGRNTSYESWQRYQGIPIRAVIAP